MQSNVRSMRRIVARPVQSTPVDYPRRILIVGNGARENAIANALLTSAQLEKLWIAPPNWGVLDPHFEDSRRVETLQIAPSDSAAMVAAAKAHDVQLVVIGPEAPLCASTLR